MKNNLVFVSAQPDVPYFHWQIKIYIHNFIEKGINPNDIHVIFAMVHGKKEPSEGSLKIKEMGVNVHYYVDEREKKHYIPSIKPFLIYKWLEEYPQYGESFFLHDADIIFRILPNFEELLNDEISYVSDTIGYIGYNYIKDCCDRYERQYPSSEKLQLLQEMCDVVGIDIDVVKENQLNSGGGQYIIKNTDSVMWEKIYNDCVPLYDQMQDYQKRFPINPGQIQFWTAEMWSVLWNLWYFDKETRITNELDFSWATDTTQRYEQTPILHMAGVTDNLKNTKFYKGEFINQDPLQKLKDDFNYFDYIDKNSSTISYIDVMKSLINEKNK
jgi:hypothetical protein